MGFDMSNCPLVSIIVPCYNVRHKMERFMDSILKQTYTKLELIFVDDGSTDGTALYIHSFEPKFLNAGMEVRYVYQENRGLGAAVNHGLKLVHGEYLMWPDPDDWLSEDSVEEKMNFLEQHQEYGVVTSNAYIYDETDTQHPIGRIVERVTDETRQENQFELLLRYKSVFCTGCHMVRMSAFWEACGSSGIFEARRGQNFQMLLPVYYKYKRFFLEKELYNYVLYRDSMSRGDDSQEKAMLRADELLEILQNTLQGIEMDEVERKKYEDMVWIDDAHERFNVAFRYGDVPLLKQMYNKLKSYHSLRHKEWILYFFGCNKFTRNILLSILRLKR